MNRLLIIAILVFGFGQINSQTVEIGQDAESVKRLIEWSTNEHNKPDSFGNYSSASVSSDVQYNNGVIMGVIQCYKNQFYVDLRMSVDFCKYYMMVNGKLAYILTQYENVSKEKIIEVYDRLYKDSKVNNLYFDEEFEYYSKIYLGKNGYATIEFRKAELDKMPANVKKEIEMKQNIIAQKKLEKEKEEQKREEITSKYYDLSKYDITTYNSIVNDVKQKIVKCFKSSEKSGNYDRSSIPTFNELLNSEEKKYQYTISFVAHYETGHGGSTYEYLELQDIIPDSISKEESISLFNIYNQIIGYTGIRPTLKIDGIEVKTEARIKISIDYAKGISVVKIKDGKLEFLENTPDKDLLEKIKSKLDIEIVGLKGKYIVNYEFSNIMGVENLCTELVKR
jgi:hypothetical protein